MKGDGTKHEALARALFRPKLADSRTALHPILFDDPREYLTDQLVLTMLKRGDELAHVHDFLYGPAMHSHPNFNSAEKVLKLLNDSEGPKFSDALTTSRRDLVQRRVNVRSVPLTSQERIDQHLQDAIQMIQKEMGCEDGESIANLMEEEEEEEDDGEVVGADILAWPHVLEQRPLANYTWLRTVWLRVNLAPIFLVKHQKTHGNSKNPFLQEKVRRFVDAHNDVIRYLESLPDPRDELIDLAKLECPPLGLSHYPDDYNLAKRTTTYSLARRTPVMILKEAFPNLLWTVDDIVEKMPGLTETELLDNGWIPVPDAKPETHRVYLGIVFLLNQCKRLIDEEATPSHLKDALWTYYAGFTDIFHYGMQSGMSDLALLTPPGTYKKRSGTMVDGEELTLWERWGNCADVRAFTPDDLPDLQQALLSLPISEEQYPVSTTVGFLLQKSLPIACWRRFIFNAVCEAMQKSDSNWRLFSRLMWVMLAGLYPGDDRAVLSMRHLLRCKELTMTQSRLCAALGTDKNTVHANGAPLLVHTAFRLYMIHMTQHNASYRGIAERAIRWGQMMDNALSVAETIRTSDLLPEDAFARARAVLSRTIKSASGKTTRLHKVSMAVRICNMLNERETTWIHDRNSRQKIVENGVPIPLGRHGEDHTVALHFYHNAFSMSCKANIVNLLLRIPEAERLIPETLLVLTKAKYGGVKPESIGGMELLAKCYGDVAKPARYAAIIDQMEVQDLVVINYYLNIVSTLEKIHFLQLSSGMVARTNEAMLKRRFRNVATGQRLPEHVWTVYVALCCDKICTFSGQGKYGAKRVAYDMERECFVCSKGKSMHWRNKLGADRDKVEGEEEGDEVDQVLPLPDDEEEDEEEEDEECQLSDEEGEAMDYVNAVIGAQNEEIEDMAGMVEGTAYVRQAQKKKADLHRLSAHEEKKERRRLERTERRRFNRVPCGQPVIPISLYGRILIWNNRAGRRTAYLFCPECAALHIFSGHNFAQALNGKYRCNECAQKEAVHLPFRQCAYCKKSNPTLVKETFCLPIMDFLPSRQVIGRDTDAAMVEIADVRTWMYFCRFHYSIARGFFHRLGKDSLWAIIERVEHRRRLKQAMRYN
jgi:hypothetical protein